MRFTASLLGFGWLGASNLLCNPDRTVAIGRMEMLGSMGLAMLKPKFTPCPTNVKWMRVGAIEPD